MEKLDIGSAPACQQFFMAKVTSFEKRRGAGRSVFFLLFETFSRERNKEFSVLYEKIQMNKNLGLHLFKKKILAFAFKTWEIVMI